MFFPSHETRVLWGNGRTSRWSASEWMNVRQIGWRSIHAYRSIDMRKIVRTGKWRFSTKSNNRLVPIFSATFNIHSPLAIARSLYRRKMNEAQQDIKLNLSVHHSFDDVDATRSGADLYSRQNAISSLLEAEITDAIILLSDRRSSFVKDSQVFVKEKSSRFSFWYFFFNFSFFGSLEIYRKLKRSTNSLWIFDQIPI